MRFSAACLFALLLPLASVCQDIGLTDAYPAEARYAPGDLISIVVQSEGTKTRKGYVSAEVYDLDRNVGHCGRSNLTQIPSEIVVLCQVPPVDFKGYMVQVFLRDVHGHVVAHRWTAVDVSSDWARYPRYGFLAHYNAAEGAQPAEWIEQLNRFHVNGLQFYDFQYRHDQPLAGTINEPAEEWKDIAGREIDRQTVIQFIEAAHARNIMAMAYNASYSGYDDVFTRGTAPLPLKWAVWSDPKSPRTAANAKSLPLRGDIPWTTSKLFYMNQNDPEWQQYLFHRMRDLFAVYAFDGWHIDTFGERDAYSYDGELVDYVSGFPQFIDAAHAALKKPIVFNAVNTLGQTGVAASDADFVYSELWEGHETFASILQTLDEVRKTNSAKAVVLAAYVHRGSDLNRVEPKNRKFNEPAVLLTDAVMFAAGGSHIELGDGRRMLSSEYFPADSDLSVGTALYRSLRHYYDFMTGYEQYLRDGVRPARIQVSVDGYSCSDSGEPNTIFTISRSRGHTRILHLINLTGSNDSRWRDIQRDRPKPHLIKDLRVRLHGSESVRSVGWASPDEDSGSYHRIRFQQSWIHGKYVLNFRLPRLTYWDTIVIQTT